VETASEVRNVLLPISLLIVLLIKTAVLLALLYSHAANPDATAKNERIVEGSVPHLLACSSEEIRGI